MRLENYDLSSDRNFHFGVRNNIMKLNKAILAYFKRR